MCQNSFQRDQVTKQELRKEAINIWKDTHTLQIKVGGNPQ
jgi:hypothetical protein